MTDHLAIGKTTRSYVYPPKLPEEEFVKDFSDGLRDILPAKINGCMERMVDLSNNRRLWLKEIKGHATQGKLDDFSRWFWTFWAELQYAESYVIQRWLRYWLDINEFVEPYFAKYMKEIKSGRLERWQLEKARQRPIEDLYKGKLYGRGNVLSGLCPFHEEKTPSFFIFRNTNRFKCFGCQSGGNSIDFIIKYKKIDFLDAIKLLL